MKDSPQQKTKYVALQAVSCSSIQSNMLIQRRALRVRFSLLFSELLFSFKSKTFRKEQPKLSVSSIHQLWFILCLIRNQFRFFYHQKDSTSLLFLKDTVNEKHKICTCQRPVFSQAGIILNVPMTDVCGTVSI